MDDLDRELIALLRENARLPIASLGVARATVRARIDKLVETGLIRGFTLALNAEAKHVDTFSFPDGRFQVRWKGQILPYAVFDKDQRVTQADIVENKRLSEVLAHIKRAQEEPRPTPKITTKKRAPRLKNDRTELPTSSHNSTISSSRRQVTLLLCTNSDIS